MITLKEIQFSYAKNKTLFKDLNLAMESGHIYGLLGKNGAGKTSLLKLMSGLLFAQSGEVTLMGHRAEHRPMEVLQNLYFLQEELYVPHLKISEFEKAYAPYYPNFSHEMFHHNLEEFEMTDEKNHIDHLSHGQKKKVLISFALATNTPILLMDEPTNGLDIPSKSIFRKLMAAAADESRLVVISTHQVRDLYSLIDIVTIVDSGRILLNAGTDVITDKLLFDVDNQKSNSTETIYEEVSPLGTVQVKYNTEHRDSNLDLELLFNAAISQQEKIHNLFK